MVSKELNDWLQVVGLFGVLGGLIFVGLQDRQDRQIALIEGVQAGTDDLKYWAELMDTSAELWAKGLADESLSEADAIRFEALASALELQYFNAWNRQVLLGVPERAERWVREAALDFSTHPGLMKFWISHRERQALVAPDRSLEWEDAVSSEIDRLQTK